jgi:hypothetical protein
VGGTFGTNVANVAGHGVIGGAKNVAMGGKFQDGFLSGAAAGATAVSGLTSPDTGIGQSLTIAGRTAIASAAGGTASVLGGGKFANGAMTGAMTHLLNAEAGRAIGRAVVRQQARTIRVNIQKDYDNGVRDFSIGNIKIDILARASLYNAIDSKSEYINLSANDFLKHIGGTNGDSVFVLKWADAKFNVSAAGGMAPVGTFQASDINYYYFTYKTTIYSNSQDAGAFAGHAANLGWNVGEAIFGNDLSGQSRSPLSQAIGQIPRTAPWIEYGSNMLGKHHLDK